MSFSFNCIELIQKFEGCKLEAYLEPAGVWTIGWGTTYYPDGRMVRQGDAITQEEADGFLYSECHKNARSVSDFVKVDVNQNQFDALVSFTYNIGVGALKDSTLLRKLNKGDYEGAADEFKRWNKIVKDGQKVVSPGLVNRRNAEAALFRKPDGFGQPIKLEPSPQYSVSLLEGYRTEKNLVVVAYHNEQVIEIVELKTSLPDDVIDFFKQYPKAKKFDIAPANKEIPQGKRIIFNGRQAPRKEEENLLKRSQPLLYKGMSDDNLPGHEIRELQTRLQELDYYKSEPDGIFGNRTEKAVREFQVDVLGYAEADGKVGPKTWAALYSNAEIPSDKSKLSPGTYLRLTKTNRKDKYGCFVLILKYIKDGQLKGQLEVCSGKPGKQFFRTGSKSKSGSMEPLPEGKWYIKDIRWAGGKDVYSGTIFMPGVGPVTTPVIYKGPGETQRSDIEIHIDWNRNNHSPGTAGCIGVKNIADYKILVGWLRDTDPRDLYVDWDLGTCPKPSRKSI
ncbi:MAG: glycoside hydrolase family protein [Cyanobacteria bacterium SBLK]|nr:glycoside hydrolase family protein [Cyanobacteria bacterium SBLK]